jgi:MoxR-like ATPase
MNASLPVVDRIAQFRAQYSALASALRGAIVGQDRVVDQLLVALLAGGHVLLEGLPGLGKTHLVKAIARCLGIALARIQCTPDLMPTDITGGEMIVSTSGATPQLEFRPGPIFAPIVLVDEVNRCTPKTQAALLEAMQEHQVTYGGSVHRLPEPFWVVATQNPIELEGTYPLPEAQLDRFLFKLNVPFPDADALTRLLDVSLDSEPADALDVRLPLPQCQAMMALAREVIVAEPVRRAAVELVLATQAGAHGGAAARHIQYGASPRGLQSLVRAARILALRDGRVHLATDDLAEAALPALRHRVLLKLESTLDGVRVDDVLAEIVTTWRRNH